MSSHPSHNPKQLSKKFIRKRAAKLKPKSIDLDSYKNKPRKYRKKYTQNHRPKRTRYHEFTRRQAKEECQCKMEQSYGYSIRVFNVAEDAFQVLYAMDSPENHFPHEPRSMGQLNETKVEKMERKSKPPKNETEELMKTNEKLLQKAQHFEKVRGESSVFFCLAQQFIGWHTSHRKWKRIRKILQGQLRNWKDKTKD